MKTSPCIVCLILTTVFFAYAQESDSLTVRVGTLGTLASKNFQPLWLESNRFGVISGEGADLATYIGGWNRHTVPLGRKELRIDYGINLVNNRHFNHVIVQQGYLKVRYGVLEFRGGRFEEILGEVDPLLSTGSLGLSGNALPIPKIGAAFPDYVDVPFTNGWLQVKGSLSHGWMGYEQSMKRAWLHEKSFYARLGKGPFRIFGGLQHFALWGGQRGHIRLDRSLRGFFDVLFVKEANDGYDPDGIHPNRAGDQRGLLEFGGDLELPQVIWHLYFQVPFESGMGIDIRNIDRVGGLNIVLKAHRWLRRVMIEFIYTKQMESFQSAELQSYYNNGLYASGWEYQYRSIGTPLFLNRSRGSRFLPVQAVNWSTNNDRTMGNRNFINNRIVGGHIGILHRYTQHMVARTMLTYTRNYGTHNRNSPITGSPQNQIYGLHEVTVELNGIPGLAFSGGIALDAGGFYDNFGGLLGIRYNFKKHL